MGQNTAYYRILVAAETDATRYYGPKATRPAVLGTSDAEQMLSHIAADLRNLLPDIASCSLIAPGALFDQTQLLQPGYPVFRALEDVSLDDRAERFKPGLVSLGAQDGRLPVSALQPDPGVPPGLLQLLPVVLHGPADEVQRLGQEMEYRFLEEGQISAHSATWLQSAFGISVTHARLMTLTDLLAMLRLQLDHFGFLPLWELLDAALSSRSEPLTVTSATGIEFEWRDGRVRAPFQTFNYWAGHGAGCRLPAPRQALSDQYADWTRELRQYLTTLQAHRVPVDLHLPGHEQALAGSFFCEEAQAPEGRRLTAVTEHTFDELGTLVVSVVNGNRLQHYYPLSASGLNDIHLEIQRIVPAGHTVSYPGALLYDEETRQLAADTRDAASPDHS
ncbi:MAG: hypothetical protein HKO85_12065 [Xanthomonadales bacterium]|nr:hypothetical protein [Gammaproteobacteria bacterium]MBT8049879.1 hypothetical protein [Gammaproteobacteria bacterium]MBT8057094.1 hypothetical protein [Gammaproteobacteria bacterium]NNJ79372.1 hypothetical protein [Xanthomonadales bacterium]NNL06013.1 hypothetical protein [Xanthomonadales bacterium]